MMPLVVADLTMVPFMHELFNLIAPESSMKTEMISYFNENYMDFLTLASSNPEIYDEPCQRSDIVGSFFGGMSTLPLLNHRTTYCVRANHTEKLIALCEQIGDSWGVEINLSDNLKQTHFENSVANTKLCLNEANRQFSQYGLIFWSMSIGVDEQQMNMSPAPDEIKARLKACANFAGFVTRTIDHGQALSVMDKLGVKLSIGSGEENFFLDTDVAYAP